MIDCSYHGDYNHPANWDGVCVATPAVPEGCPIHLMVPVEAALAVMPRVVRNGNEITLTSSSVVEETLDQSIATIDVFSCDCSIIGAVVSFERIALTINGAVEGDAIGFAGDQNAESASAAITAPGPCPTTSEVMWPTSFHQSTACDRCPVGDPIGDPVGDPAGTGSGSGCSTGDGAGWAGIVFAASAIVLRRRYTK